jgi:hypothetical protein
MNRLAIPVAALLLLGMVAASAAPDPFQAPVQDCHPCRFSPGPGLPEVALTFVFKGAGDGKVLTGFDVTPTGGTLQHLATGDVAVSDFPDGFTLTDADFTGSGHGDLGLVTLAAADNASETYWLYDAGSRHFVPLQRDDAHGGDCGLSWQGQAFRCHVKGSAIEYADFSYRLGGDRTVAVGEEDQSIAGPLLVQTVSDLSAKPARVVKTVTVGFVGESPQRAQFYQQLEAASKRAATAYKAGDKPGAVAALEPLLKDKNLEALTDAVPVTNGNAPADLRVVAELNDYGFYLAEAGRSADAVDALSAVIDLDPDRVPAYLNLADAQVAAGDAAGAKTNYAEYQKRMTAAGKAARIPPRVADRLR